MSDEDLPQRKRNSDLLEDDFDDSDDDSSSPKQICLPTDIFTFVPRSVPLSIPEHFLLIEQVQCQNLQKIQFSEPVDYIYNPLEYAFETHADFIYRFCNSEKKVLFLGMNPGPFGMAQNGVPFGEAKFVRDWMQIKGNVYKPNREHPKRKIEGLKCMKSEVSGNRFWSLFKSICKTPENFFKDCFVHNVCPLMFMRKSSKNITPPELKAEERKQLTTVCNKSFCEALKLLNVKLIIGVGKFAAVTAAEALKSVHPSFGCANMKVVSIMHPSPINPAANKGWDAIAKKSLKDLDILDYTDWSELKELVGL